MAKLKRDNFGNPIYDQTVTYAGAEVQFTNTVHNSLIDTVFSGDEQTTDAFCEALLDRWHNYGIQSSDEFSLIDEKAVTEMFDWAMKELTRTVKALWRRYKDIVEAYKTKVDWASGIINTTTYKDVKDTSQNTGESTDWALPNKKVESPYGTPTSHAENKGGNTNTKTGAVETKGMLNPVTQRDLYARLIRDAFGEMAEECAPLFNQMHL